jgi:hypothetical protein
MFLYSSNMETATESQLNIVYNGQEQLILLENSSEKEDQWRLVVQTETEIQGYDVVNTSAWTVTS